MSVLSDRQIRELAKGGMIVPFSEGERRPGVVSYGLSSAGYDIRLGYRFKVFKAYPAEVVDPKNFDPALLEEVNLTPESPPNFIVIPPHSYVLGESMEAFDIPRDVLVVMLGKSSYARCGILVNATPGEPGWRGVWTIEIGNTTPLPVKVYAGEGIAQCLFFRTDERRAVVEEAVLEMLRGRNLQAYHDLTVALGGAGCGTSYADKRGIYQYQTGVTPPKVV